MELINTLAPIAIFAVIALFAFRIINLGMFRPVIYGSRVAKTYGEIEIPGKAGTSSKLLVHKLENGEIVVERISRGVASASMQGTQMSREAALKLGKSLIEASSNA